MPPSISIFQNDIGRPVIFRYFLQYFEYAKLDMQFSHCLISVVLKGCLKEEHEYWHERWRAERKVAAVYQREITMINTEALYGWSTSIILPDCRYDANRVSFI